MKSRNRHKYNSTRHRLGGGITLPALWTLGLAVSVGLFASAADTTTVKYDLNGVAPTVYTQNSGSSATVPNIDLSFDGMTFEGWNTHPDGTGESVKSGESLDNSTTLYAQWSDGTHLDSAGATTRNAGAKPNTSKAIIDTDITSKSNQSSSNPTPAKPDPEPSVDNKCDAKASDLDNATVTYSGEPWNDFNPAADNSFTDRDASKVKVDLSKLSNKDCWSATTAAMSDDDTVILITGRRNNASNLVYRHHFLKAEADKDSNSGATKNADGSSRANPTVSPATTGGGNNSGGSTGSSASENSVRTNSGNGAPTAGAFGNKLTAPIALIVVGLVAAIAVLRLTGSKTDRMHEAETTNRIINEIKNRVTKLTAHSGYAIIMSIAVLAVLAGSFMLSGYKINAKSVEDYSTNVKAATEYNDANGNPYNGFVTIHNLQSDTVANRKTYWWKGGAKQTGELSTGDHYWQYFDPADDGAMARNKERVIPTTANNKKWVFYNDEGYMVYGWRYLANGDKWVYYDDNTGEMLHGEAALYQNNDDRLHHDANTPKYWYYSDDYTGATTYGWKFVTSSEPHGWVYYEPNTGRMLYGNRTLPRHPDNTSEQILGDSSHMTEYSLDATTGRATETTIAQHIVNLARATGGVTGTPGGYTVGSGHGAWTAPSSTRWANDPGLQRYEKVFRATVTRMGGNGALASCAQAVSAILAATVDQYAAASNNQSDQHAVMNYLAANPDLYQNLGTIPANQRQPGDIQVSGGHVSIFISKHAGSGADIWEAHYGGNGGERARFPSIENHSSDDYVGMQVFRAKATATPIDVSSIVAY